MGFIIITGTPGVGKTTISSEISRLLGIPHIDLSRLVEEKGIWTDTDPERNGTLIVDEEALRRTLYSIARELGSTSAIIDTHYSELVPVELVEKVVVLRLHPGELKRRLEERGWPWSKIRENVEAEILGVCSYNARASFDDKVCEIDVTGMSIDQAVRTVLEAIKGETKYCKSIDWLSLLDVEALDVISSTEETP